MKSILMSIQPRKCHNITIGRQTIIVNKTKPKLTTPFKCYIYQTKSKDKAIYKQYKVNDIRSGKVIGEFVCDLVLKFTQSFFDEQEPRDTEEISFYLDQFQVSYKELCSYVGLKDFYGWHISNLKIYDKPKELSEFTTALTLKAIRCKHIEKRYKTYNGKPYMKCNLQNCVCEFRRLCTQTDCDGYEMLKEPTPLTRPPQTWCYVENLTDTNVGNITKGEL